MDKQYIVAESTILKLVEDVGAIKEGLDNFRHELTGNGQPGRIQRIETDIDQHAKDITSISRIKYMVIGGLVLAGHLLENVVKVAWDYFNTSHAPLK